MKTKSHIASSLVVSIMAIIAGMAAVIAQAENIFEDSFDYGDTEVRIDSVSGWNGNSAYAVYDPAVGLENAQLYGEVGGSLWRNYTTARDVTTNIPDFAVENLNNGDKLWLAMLLEFETGTDQHGVEITADGTVNRMGAMIATNGSVNVYAYVGTTDVQDTGIDVATGTHFLLLRYTKGIYSGGKTPVDSTIDLWINPSDTSSEAALDAAGSEWSTSECKWGRDRDYTTGTILFYLTAVTAHVQRDGHVDEIRLGQVFSEVLKTPLPQAGTLFVFE